KDWNQKCGNEPHIVDNFAVCTNPWHRTAQHGMSDLTHHGRHPRQDRRIAVRDGVEGGGIYSWQDSECECIENEMLILHLRGKACGVEQALAVPVQLNAGNTTDRVAVFKRSHYARFVGGRCERGLD